MNAIITLNEYLKKGKTFVIPNYQRGYIWGKQKRGEDKDSVTYFLEDSIIPGLKQNTEIFIQGVTVCEKANEIILIDGQQRTTFFYLLLKYLGFTEPFTIKYDIRKVSNQFLSSGTLLNNYSQNTKEKFQDIYFFKKTLRIINNELLNFNKPKNEILDYLLSHIKFLYIDIPEDKATKVFSMMNGNKAEMKAEELIKAEMLRLASLNRPDFTQKSTKEQNAIEWDDNMLRSRYARAWDRWLQWWNRADVKKLYKCSNVMGLLISTYLCTKKQENLSFFGFRKEFLSKQEPVEAKQAFDGLRRLQKRFEDAFNHPILYNKVGAILRIGDRDAFIQWYFVGRKPADEELDKYYNLSFIGLTHNEVTDYINNKNLDTFNEKFDNTYKILEGDNLYKDKGDREEAFRLLFRLNIDEDNKQEAGKGRKFDFSIWDGERSLEHIYPKSKVWHEEQQSNGTVEIVTGDGKRWEKATTFDKSYIKRNSCIYNDKYASEHSIGNLVLLYGRDNSAFGNKSFEEKKQTFFEPSEKEIFESRHLLHTIYKFAKSTWTGKEIAENKWETLKEFKEKYGK